MRQQINAWDSRYLPWWLLIWASFGGKRHLFEPWLVFRSCGILKHYDLISLIINLLIIEKWNKSSAYGIKLWSGLHTLIQVKQIESHRHTGSTQWNWQSWYEGTRFSLLFGIFMDFSLYPTSFLAALKGHSLSFLVWSNFVYLI